MSGLNFLVNPAAAFLYLAPTDDQPTNQNSSPSLSLNVNLPENPVEFPNDKTTRVFSSLTLGLGFQFGVADLIQRYLTTNDPSFLGAAVFSTTLAVIASRLYAWDVAYEIWLKLTKIKRV